MLVTYFVTWVVWYNIKDISLCSYSQCCLDTEANFSFGVLYYYVINMFKRKYSLGYC